MLICWFINQLQSNTDVDSVPYKKLSYHRGMAPRAILVNMCCFTRYGS